ncbi:uncharacterized protein [Prorops nasuta]|uniref:uncharacterized protein n=1 Tax=Prorops nasuta TaxID=863751 RepID=UPI0034CD2E7D
MLNHRGHMSHHPCSKCTVVGRHENGRSVFNSTTFSLRTDVAYSRCVDRKHHKEGQSPLAHLPIGMVSDVPFEYMHLVCLGVMKRILSAWVLGTFSPVSKLSTSSYTTVCSRLNTLRQFCPSDFARRPQSLDVFSKFKATEFRQFLLYTGPLVLYGLTDDSIYKHFLLLHSAIRVLVASASTLELRFAEISLQKFVQRCYELYGPSFCSYNLHGLLHLTNDVRHLGNLDSFSAFPYESNMMMFRKYCRKPHLSLQQFCRRMDEIQFNSNQEISNDDPSIPKFVHYRNTNNRAGYSKILFNNLLLTTEIRDNCCLLRDNSICVIVDIVINENLYLLQVKKFIELEPFYDIGIKSSDIGIYKCSSLHSEIVSVPLSNVVAKCYRMPFFSKETEHANNTDIDENSTYVVFTIIHSEN